MEHEAMQLTTRARRLAGDVYYAKAFNTYIKMFYKYPEMKDQLEPEFRLVLNKLNRILVTENKIDDIFNNFERAIKVYPGNIYLINDLGKYLYEYGYYIEACCHFQKALKLDSGYVEAEKNLNNAKNFLVERWHFRMLNDKVRNNAYHEAITKAIIPEKSTILDLGAGTGLLTMFAAECRPAASTAVEASETMADIAHDAFYDNKLQLILLINKMSTTLNYLGIGGKRSIIITELFDAGLFGEHILDTLHHAWGNFISDVGRVIPSHAEFFAVGAKCDTLNLKYQLNKMVKSILNISDLTVHIDSMDPYDSEDVHLHKDITYLTKPQSVVKVDFNNPSQLNEMITNTKHFDVYLKAKEAGEINMIIGWFELNLTKEIMLTTNPTYENRANAWQQAIFYDFIPKTVSKNDKVALKFNITDNKLSLIPEDKPEIIRISKQMLRFLNDADYMKALPECVEQATAYLGNLVAISHVAIVDLSPFPYFGMLLMKKGAQSLFCCAKNDKDKQFIEKIFEVNKIDMSGVTIILDDNVSEAAFKNIKFHVIFYNLLDLCGVMSTDFKLFTNYLKRVHIVPGGLVLPSKITLMGQIINSEWLDINNRLYDTNLRGYKLSQYLNKYQVSQNICIDFENLEYEEISEVANIGDINTDLKPDEISVPIIKDGFANAIICWYILELFEGKNISTKRANSFIDGMVYLANPKLPMKKGQSSNILRCVDSDGDFKLVIDATNN